ncbi:trypsin-like peptidase domain-containing protein [Streptomyces sp. NPDC001657]|uniref:trypsin-like serine peptidase n=1 Tax=Streptomyces sp. NPDC001657 TaxID=3154522 RepID=UPI0033305CF4
MKRIPWARAAALGACVSLAIAVPALAARDTDNQPVPPAAATDAAPTPPPVTAQAIRDARATEHYWTPERIRAAVPMDAVQDGGKGQDAAGAPGAGRRSMVPTHRADAGVATVGVFLIRTADGSATPNQFCSASAVASPTKSLVLTAAHCLTGDKPYRDAAFVPGYRAGASQAGEAGETPYGLFPVQTGKVWIDGRYLTSSPSDDVDFAIVRVGPNSQGQLLEDAVGGGNRLTSVSATQLARKNVTLVGYPGGQKTPLQCMNDTTAFQGRFLRIQCDGFRSGVSGGPFLEHFDGSRGDLVGSIGGYKTGGPTADVSYSSQYDGDVFRLYQQAVDDAVPDSAGQLGDGSTWQHATSLTGGRFHTTSVRNGTGDLIVRWSDGELSLYPGNRQYGFGKDITLAKKNELWKQARAITAGDFAGNSTDDLLVRWANGKLTLYQDVNETNKLRNEIQLKAPNGTWTHAYGLAAGRFGGGNTRRDDLVVRWSDGEVTLYTNVDGKGLHAEKQLAKRNPTWTHAVDLAAGDFRTAAGDQDLVVRWSDGEVTGYENVAAQGLKGDHQLRPAKSAWRNGRLVTAGAYGGGTRQDDLIALWPGGKLAMNGDTTLTALGRERVLVPAQVG